jgi:hypothetical protein
MKKLIGLSLASFALAGAALALAAAAPAVGQPEKKTELVELDGKAVDSMLLRYAFDATWAVDEQHILVRDTYRDHYLVTLKSECEKLEMQRGIKFFPALAGRIRASLRYEVRDPVGQPCDITRVEQIDQERANELKAASKANDD